MAQPTPGKLLARVRKICLALPEATEKEAWGAPTFRAGRMFATFADHYHDADWVALWAVAPPGAQELLVDGDPERFFVPPYVGGKGWVGVVLDGAVDWGMVAEAVEEAYRMIAPKRCLDLLDTG